MDIGKFSRNDRRGWPRAWRKLHTVISGLLLVVGALAAAAWYTDQQRQIRETSAKLNAVEQALAGVEKTLGDTELARVRLQGFIDAVKSSTEDRRVLLGPALQGIRASIEPGTEISSIEAGADSAHPGGWSLRVQGSLSGAAPRVLADRGRLKLQEALAARYQVTEPARFEHFDSAEAEAGAASGRKALFTTVASVAPLNQPRADENHAP